MVKNLYESLLLRAPFGESMTDTCSTKMPITIHPAKDAKLHDLIEPEIRDRVSNVAKELEGNGGYLKYPSALAKS